MTDDQNAVEAQLQMAQAEPLDLVEAPDGDTVETAALTILRPAPGVTQTVATLGGTVYVLDLDPTQAQVLIESGDMILLFDDGGRIVFENLVGLVQGGNTPGLEIDGRVIGGDVLLGQALALADADEILDEEVLTLETAAGGQGTGGGGSSQYQDDFNEIIATLFAEGPIPFTELAFGSFGGTNIVIEEEPAPTAGITPPVGTLIILGPGPDFGTPADGGAPASPPRKARGPGSSARIPERRGRFGPRSGPRVPTRRSRKSASKACRPTPGPTAGRSTSPVCARRSRAWAGRWTNPPWTALAAW